MPDYPSITALDRLLDDLVVGEARRRQLGMVRGEVLRALGRGALPVAARRGLRRLLEEEALGPYLRLAESGALRARLVDGQRPPTSEAGWCAGSAHGSPRPGRRRRHRRGGHGHGDRPPLPVGVVSRRRPGGRRRDIISQLPARGPSPGPAADRYASRSQDPAGLLTGDVTLHPRGLVIAIPTGKTKHSVRNA
ncbi:hypothetical protein [Streptomyces sp. C10]|uniref:hypothetical protein n=1 Tax=Streptomyces sp. C10 TaxID=531941 RepID=UPI003980BDF9